MSAASRSTQGVAQPWGEHAQAIALVLPAAVLLWFGPGAPLEGDPNRELTGSAIAAFAALPALVLAFVRRNTSRAPWLLAFVAFAALGVVSLVVHPPTDTLEADRASLVASVALAAALGGASLGALGRESLVRALALVTLFALVPALVLGELRFAGALGNTGSTSEVAVLGAIAGVWLFGRDVSAWRWIGGASALVHAAYCGAAPVLSGAIVLGLGFAVALIASRGRRAWIAVLLASTAIAFVTARLATSSGVEIAAASRAAGDTGGARVRELIWRGTAKLVGDYGALGAGPGQFAAAFPPYRDPLEIDLSSHGRTLVGVETEVEHAHNDVLQGFADAGIAGGLAWLALLGAVAWASWRTLREHDGDRGALGAIGLGALANALLREPLLWNPASSSAAFAVFGALLTQPRRGRVWVQRAWLAAAAAVLVVQVPRAWNIVEHGRALAEYLRTHDEGALAAALHACRDSIDARELEARQREARGDERSRVIDAWRAVLALRPHRVEALMQLGKAYALEQRAAAARAAWAHAATLDPGNPTLLRNFARMEALIGDLDEAQRWCARARCDAERMFPAWAAEALCALDIERGWKLLARTDAKFADLTPDRAYQLARESTPKLDPRVAAALEGSAHVAWAREHAEAKRFADAVRSYRQAKRGLNLESNESAPPRWSPQLRLELAAALALDDKLDDARRELDGVDLAWRDVYAAPLWVGEALQRTGLLLPLLPLQHSRHRNG